MASDSCSTPSCENISSSVGTAIRTLSRCIESSATTLPRCRITTWEQTRSTVSSSCESEEHHLTPYSQLSNQAAQDERGPHIEPGKRLIKQYQVWIVYQGRREQYLLPHTF